MRRAPSGLHDAGRALWRALAAFEPEEHETRLLVEACRVADRLEALAEVIEKDGPMTTNRHGESIPHPAIVEARQQQITLARLIAALNIPAEGDDVPMSAASRKAAKAAASRWGMRDAQRARL